MRKLVCILLCVLALVGVCAGCQDSGLTKLTVNEVTHSVFYAPFYAAIELKYFEEVGIEVDLVNGGGSDKSMTALLSGDAQIILAGPETAVYVYNEGQEDHPVIIGQLTKKDGSLLVSREPMEDFEWADLEGKYIIGGRFGGMPQMTLDYVLRGHGLVPGENVTVDTSITFNLMAGAFEGSDADFVTLFEPTASLCEEQGVGYIVDAVGSQTDDIPYTAFMVKKSTLNGKLEVYDAFIDAVKRAQEWVNQNDAAKVAEVIAPQFPDSDVPLLTKVVENYKAIDCWKQDCIMTEEAFNRLLDVIEAAGAIDKRADFAQVVYNKLAE